jgi:uncharacterized membrane protein
MAIDHRMDSVSADLPVARRVPFDAPWSWLAAGWRDLWRIPQISLTYGLIAAVGAAIIAVGLARLEAISLFLALAGGFLLLGPLLAVGLYDASRRLALGQSPRLADVFSAARNSKSQLAFFGALLLIIYLAWLRLAFLLLMLFLGSGAVPPPSDFMQTLLFTPNGVGLLVVGTIAGGILAAITFAISAFGVPLLLDRRMDAVSAGWVSASTVLANAKPLLLWAALIVVLMAAGFATLLVGLVVVVPLIGLATWHAYADVFPSSAGVKPIIGQPE